MPQATAALLVDADKIHLKGKTGSGLTVIPKPISHEPRADGGTRTPMPCGARS